MRNNSKKVDESKMFKEVMTQFVLEDDPLLSMMKWMMEQLMKIESELKVGVKKGEHNSERKSYFSGYRIRRFDTRLSCSLFNDSKDKKRWIYSIFHHRKKKK